MKSEFYKCKNMQIKDIMSKIRNVYYVMIHNNGGSKLIYLEELGEDDCELEFDWFEITTYLGKPCIEFNL